MSEDHSLLRNLPEGAVITGRLEFHNFEPIVQLMTVLELTLGDDHPEEEWDELCAFYQVDPDEQREFRAALRARLDEENE